MQRIAIFRALALGDLLCATPAWRALRHAWPNAEFTLVGLPWARELVRRMSLIDRFIEFPGYPGLPERAFDAAGLPRFLARMRAERFDLLLQMHGSGSISNPLMAACDARHTAGFVAPGGWCAEPALHAPWPSQGHEIERMLTLTDYLHLPRRGCDMEFPLGDEDRAALEAAWPGRRSVRSYVCVHAGAQLPSRRWATERFATVARELHAAGHTVVLTGTPGERALVESLKARMGAPVVDLCGRTTLGSLGALIEGARLLLCNDTGVSHVAAALGTRSVVVSSGADVTRWSPLDHVRHQVVWHDTPCRPCTYRECPWSHACADGVSEHRVMRAVAEALAQ